MERVVQSRLCNRPEDLNFKEKTVIIDEISLADKNVHNIHNLISTLNDHLNQNTEFIKKLDPGYIKTLRGALNIMYKYLKEFGVWCLHEYLGVFSKSLKKIKLKDQIVVEDHLTIINRIIQFIQDNFDLGDIFVEPISSKKISSMITHIIQAKNDCTDDSFRCVVVVDTKLCALVISKLINKMDVENIKADFLVSHNTVCEYVYMTEARQINLIQDFSRGDINVLVSTDVGQEVPDKPPCDLVISLNLYQNHEKYSFLKGWLRLSKSTLIHFGTNSAKSYSILNNLHQSVTRNKGLTCWDNSMIVRTSKMPLGESGPLITLENGISIVDKFLNKLRKTLKLSRINFEVQTYEVKVENSISYVTRVRLPDCIALLRSFTSVLLPNKTDSIKSAKVGLAQFFYEIGLLDSNLFFKFNLVEEYINKNYMNKSIQKTKSLQDSKKITDLSQQLAQHSISQDEYAKSGILAPNDVKQEFTVDLDSEMEFETTTNQTDNGSLNQTEANVEEPILSSQPNCISRLHQLSVKEENESSLYDMYKCKSESGKHVKIKLENSEPFVTRHPINEVSIKLSDSNFDYRNSPRGPKNNNSRFDFNSFEASRNESCSEFLSQKAIYEARRNNDNNDNDTSQPEVKSNIIDIDSNKNNKDYKNNLDKKFTQSKRITRSNSGQVPKHSAKNRSLVVYENDWLNHDHNDSRNASSKTKSCHPSGELGKVYENPRPSRSHSRKNNNQRNPQASTNYNKNVRTCDEKEINNNIKDHSVPMDVEEHHNHHPTNKYEKRNNKQPDNDMRQSRGRSRQSRDKKATDENNKAASLPENHQDRPPYSSRNQKSFLRSQSRPPQDVNMQSGRGRSQSRPPQEVNSQFGRGRSQSRPPQDVNMQSGRGRSQSRPPQDVINQFGRGRSQSRPPQEVNNQFGRGRSQSRPPQDVNNQFARGRSQSRPPQDANSQFGRNSRSKSRSRFQNQPWYRERSQSRPPFGVSENQSNDHNSRSRCRSKSRSRRPSRSNSRQSRDSSAYNEPGSHSNNNQAKGQLWKNEFNRRRMQSEERDVPQARSKSRHSSSRDQHLEKMETEKDSELKPQPQFNQNDLTKQNRYQRALSGPEAMESQPHRQRFITGPMDNQNKNGRPSDNNNNNNEKVVPVGYSRPSFPAIQENEMVNLNKPQPNFPMKTNNFNQWNPPNNRMELAGNHQRMRFNQPPPTLGYMIARPPPNFMLRPPPMLPFNRNIMPPGNMNNNKNQNNFFRPRFNINGHTPMPAKGIFNTSGACFNESTPMPPRQNLERRKTDSFIATKKTTDVQPMTTLKKRNSSGLLVSDTPTTEVPPSSSIVRNDNQDSRNDRNPSTCSAVSKESGYDSDHDHSEKKIPTSYPITKAYCLSYPYQKSIEPHSQYYVYRTNFADPNIMACISELPRGAFASTHQELIFIFGSKVSLESLVARFPFYMSLSMYRATFEMIDSSSNLNASQINILKRSHKILTSLTFNHEAYGNEFCTAFPDNPYNKDLIEDPERSRINCVISVYDKTRKAIDWDLLNDLISWQRYNENPDDLRYSSQVHNISRSGVCRHSIQLNQLPQSQWAGRIIKPLFASENKGSFLCYGPSPDKLTPVSMITTKNQNYQDMNFHQHCFYQNEEMLSKYGYSPDQIPQGVANQPLASVCRISRNKSCTNPSTGHKLKQPESPKLYEYPAYFLQVHPLPSWLLFQLWLAPALMYYLEIALKCAEFTVIIRKSIEENSLVSTDKSSGYIPDFPISIADRLDHHPTFFLLNTIYTPPKKRTRTGDNNFIEEESTQNSSENFVVGYTKNDVITNQMLGKIDKNLQPCSLTRGISKRLYPSDILPVLTLVTSNLMFNIDHYRWFGKSLLNFISALNTYFVHPNLSNIKLYEITAATVSHRKLIKVALKLDIGRYIISHHFSSRDYVPPRFTFDQNKLNEEKLKDDVRFSHKFSSKNLTDCIEGLFGRLFKHIGSTQSLKFFELAGLTFEAVEFQGNTLKVSINNQDYDKLSSLGKMIFEDSSYTLKKTFVFAIEHHLRYTFKYPALAVQAFTSPENHQNNRIFGDNSHLIFLGKGLYNFMVANRIFTYHGYLPVNNMSSLRTHMTSASSLEETLTKNGFSDLIHREDELIGSSSQAFSRLRNRNSSSVQDKFTLSQKTISLLYAFMASVFLDTKGDFDKVDEIFWPLFGKEFSVKLETLPVHRAFVVYKCFPQLHMLIEVKQEEDEFHVSFTTREGEIFTAKSSSKTYARALLVKNIYDKIIISQRN